MCCPYLIWNIQIGENLYREQGRETAEKVISHLSQYPIELVDVDRDLAKDAALLKGKYKIAYAACFAAALAKRMNAIVLTGDPEFKILQNEIEVLWL